MIIPSEILSYYKKRYSVVTKWSPNSYYDECVKWVGNISGQRVLDVGCGYGEILTRIVNSGGEAYGVEIVSEAIKWAKKTAPKAVTVLAPAENLPFNDDFFDLVICSGSLEHFVNVKDGLKEIRRVQKPAGRLLAVVPNKNWIGKINRWFEWINRSPHLCPQDQPIDREADLKSWMDLFRNNDFVVKWWKPYNIDVLIFKADQIPPAFCYHFVLLAKPTK